jgi:hypothetical protein
MLGDKDDEVLRRRKMPLQSLHASNVATSVRTRPLRRTRVVECGLAAQELVLSVALDLVIPDRR